MSAAGTTAEDRAAGRRACLALAGVAALFFAPALALRGIYYQGDVVNYTSRIAFTGEWLRKGVLPLWNPFLSLGGPHAGDPVSPVFYPLHPLLAVVFGNRLYGFDLALHVFLAALGMFALSRRLALTPAAALLSAIAYAFGAFTFGHLQHLNVIVGQAWIPVLLAATHRYIERGDRRSMSLAALALGLLILGAHVQIAAYGLLGWGMFAAFWLVTRDRRDGRTQARLSLGLVCVCLLGLALASAFLLPFAEWLMFVSRSERMTYEYATSYSWPPSWLATFVAPLWFVGSPAAPWRPLNLVEWSSYVGVLPLGFAAVALTRPSRKVLFLAGLAFCALVLASGHHTPIYRYLLSLPVLGWVRVPARFLLLAVLGISLLAGLGFDSLRSGGGRLGARGVAAAFVLLGASIARAAAAGLRRSVPWLPERRDPLTFDRYTCLLLVALVVAAVLLWVLARRRRGGDLLTALVLAATVADLYAVKRQLFFNETLAPTDSLDRPSASAEAIREGDEPHRFYTTVEEAPQRLLDRGGIAAYRELLSEGITSGLAATAHLQSLTGYLYEPPIHEDLLRVIRKRGQFDSRSAHLAGVFGIRYVISTSELSAPEMTLLARSIVGVYRNDAATPRAYLAPEGRPVASAAEAFALVKRPDFDPRNTVAVEGAPTWVPDHRLTIARVALVGETPNRLTFDTMADARSWLVVNDTFAPGWHATIDGREAPVVRANSLVRGVAVDAGRHRVSLVYEPASVRWGLGISAVALAIGGVLLRRGRLPRRGDPRA